MSINAIVGKVIREADGSGRLELSGDERGQNALYFDASPADIGLLDGRQIWGGDNSLILGRETQIAERLGYTKIRFVVGSFAGIG